MWLPWPEAEQRFAATRFAEGDVSAQAAFERVVESLPDLQVVVIRTALIPQVSGLLETRGFIHTVEEGEYSILWK